MPRKNKSLFWGILFIMTLTLSGCDQITAFMDSIFKPKKASEQTQPAASSLAQNKQETGPLSKNTLARIGSWSISMDEFNERLDALREVVPNFDADNPEVKKAVLEELIRQQLLVEDAKKSGLANKKEIVAAVDEFRRTLIVRETAANLTKDIDVSDEEARAFYEEKKDVLVDPIQIRVREIVVNSQIKANELLVELLKGADFAETAKANSVGASAINGGDLGFLEELPFPEMGEELITLQQGEISSVFKGPEGYYIIKIEEKSGGNPIAYEDIKDDIITNRLLFKQQQSVLGYIDGLKKKYKVEINDGLLN